MSGTHVGSEPLARIAGSLLPDAVDPGDRTAAVLKMPAGLTLSLHGDLGELAALWRAFEREAQCTVFQTHGWLSHWQSAVGVGRGTLPAVVVGRDGAGKVACIFQLSVERSGPGRKLTWLGSDLCDYNAPLLARDCLGTHSAREFAELWRSIVDLIAADQRFRFDYVDLEKMPPAIGGDVNPFLWLPVTAHPSGAHVATLGRDWESFYAERRSASTRKTERKQLKQLTALGDVRFVEVSEPSEIAATMEELFVQKAKSFDRMGVESIFDRPGYLEFYRGVALDPAMADIVHVARLDVGGTVAATSFGLRFGGCYYLVLSTYRDGELSRYGTGRIHLRELLRTAIERHFTLFDFTVGDETYKNEWCDVELKLVDCLTPRTFIGSAIVAGIRGYRLTKRTIKQTPVLWAAYVRARSLAGSIKRRLGR